MESSRGECEWRIGEFKRWVRRMCKLTEVFGRPFQRSGAAKAKERLQNFKEDETGGRDKEIYGDARVDPGGWMVRSWRM